MRRKINQYCKYSVKIKTNGHLIGKEFEGPDSQLPQLAQQYMAFVNDQMFSPEGDYYFQRDLEIRLFTKETREVSWDTAEVLDIFVPEQDQEMHLLNWDDEARRLPYLPKRPIKFGTVTYNVLEQNFPLYQVLGELKTH